MKPYYTLVALASILFIASCGKKEDTPALDEEMQFEDYGEIQDEPELEYLDEEGLVEENLETYEDPEELVKSEKKSELKSPSLKKEVASASKPSEGKMPSATVTPNPLKNSTPGNFELQIGIYDKKTAAEAKQNSLRKSGVESFLAEVTNPTASMQGTFYRVRVGGFNSREEAYDYAQAKLVPLQQDYWIDRAGGSKASLSSPRPPAPAPEKKSLKVEKKVAPMEKEAPAEKPGVMSAEDPAVKMEQPGTKEKEEPETKKPGLKKFTFKKKSDEVEPKPEKKTTAAPEVKNESKDSSPPDKNEELEKEDGKPESEADGEKAGPAKKFKPKFPLRKPFKKASDSSKSD